MRIYIVAFIAALIALPAMAEQAIKLKQAPGVDKVEANCQACHTLAYIPMIKAYGAPIEDADAKAIADYLAKNYGT
jgi:sulfite dehydrogenase (cytochrome) subunit B